MRCWAVLAILTYLKYVPVAAFRPPSTSSLKFEFLELPLHVAQSEIVGSA